MFIEGAQSFRASHRERYFYCLGTYVSHPYPHQYAHIQLIIPTPRWSPSTLGDAVVSHCGPFSRFTTPEIWEPVLHQTHLSPPVKPQVLSTQPPPHLQNSFLPHWISSSIFAPSPNTLSPTSIPSFIPA